MLSKNYKASSLLQRAFQARAFGAVDSSPRETFHDKRNNQTVHIPTDEDWKVQAPQNPNFMERLFRWMGGRWHPNRDDILDNDEVSKRSFSYWAYSSPVFHNTSFLSLTQFFFDLSKKEHANPLSRNILRHENNQVLYSSPAHGDAAVGAGLADYAVTGLFGYMALAKPTMAIPLAFLMWKAPARVMISKYFVLHAELMPHTE